MKNLEIFINKNESDSYGEMKLIGKDLPSSLKCLKLRCGFTLEQFKELFKTCNVSLETIIIDSFDWNYDHMKVITRFIKNKKSVKVLGIVSMDHKTLQELTMLKKRYGIFIIPSNELSRW